jgi:hypothetical protein
MGGIITEQVLERIPGARLTAGTRTDPIFGSKSKTWGVVRDVGRRMGERSRRWVGRGGGPGTQGDCLGDGPTREVVLESGETKEFVSVVLPSTIF